MKARSIPALLGICLLLTACGKTAVPPSSSPTPAQSPISSAASSAPTLAKNPLTGLYDLPKGSEQSRPVAVMIGNIKQALPQSGLEKADVCYEILAEGGITRIMAVFPSSAQLPTTGPVRSARDYFLDYAQGLDALFVHFGTSIYAESALRERGYDHIDGMKNENAFWRDAARRRSKGLEHSAYTNADTLGRVIESKKLATTLDKPAAFAPFHEPDAPVTAGDLPAKTVAVTFSGAAKATFEYDATSNAYRKGEFGQAHIDANTGSQLRVTNVVVIGCPTRIADSGGERLRVTTSGTGTGYYISGGTACEITYSKESADSPLVLKDKSGNPLTLNAGKTWVCVVDSRLEKPVSLS
jgi:hypothetical protein